MRRREIEHELDHFAVPRNRVREVEQPPPRGAVGGGQQERLRGAQAAEGRLAAVADAQAAHESSADPDKAAIAPTVAAALNLSRNWYQLALETKGDLSLLDDERAKVMSMPSVRSVLGCHGTFQVS